VWGIVAMVVWGMDITMENVRHACDHFVGEVNASRGINGGNRVFIWAFSR
jgi:hypothetical protein